MYNFQDIAPIPPFPRNEPEFINELRKFCSRTPHWMSVKKIPENMLDIRGKWIIGSSFPDPENLLDSAYDAITRFAKKYTGNTSSPEVKISSVADNSLAFEEYRIKITSTGITLAAADTEGLRRAVYALLDLVRSSDIPALSPQTISKKPWLKNRISRCFFGPIKRPPFFRDELTDDTDYYPEGYLDMLASEGVNGIWLTVVWKELAKNSFFPEDPLREKRITKLRNTVAKCRKYGIKVWIFCIEPASWKPDNPLPQGFEDMCGVPAFEEYRAFCIASENSFRYIRETSASIFGDVPDLGGMMLISLGERPTSCLSYIYSSPEGKLPCADQCHLSNPQILNRVLSAIKAGAEDAGSKAEVLSWLYNPRPQQIPDWWFELPAGLDEEKILAFNFESGCTKAQTGKVHAGGDYWLSAIGPSDRFGRMAAAAKNNCGFAAKLQVGCSHESATVPFMPVPGNLYHKYRAMKNLGVHHVIQCWYFGNYPGLMNRAAGMLAFENFEDDELTFLRNLARPEWGNAMSEKVAVMWQKFGMAYNNYPLDIQFQYYGPMHDGIVWPLHIKHSMRSLPRSWKPDQFPAGDTIGEALVNHSLADAEILAGLLSTQWDNAIEILPELRQKFADDQERMRDCDLYEALDLLFNSGARILTFYHLRQVLLSGGSGVIPDMLDLISKEKYASLRMIELCQSDCRLGYHSEAEVYKYFPEKLRWRIGELDKCTQALRELQNLPAEDIKNILAWEGIKFHTGKSYQADTFCWSAIKNGNELQFRIKYFPLEQGISLEQRQLLLMDASGTKFPILVNVSTGEQTAYCEAAQGIKVTALTNDEYTVTVPWGKFDYAKTIFAGVQRTWFDAERKFHSDNTPSGEYDPDPRLNFNGFSPERLGLLYLE